MRIYLRHIWRTIKAHPLQPILILLTVMLAVGTAVTAFRFNGAFAEYAEKLEHEQRALGDITVSLGDGSEERLLFSDDAKDYVGELGEVLGEYTLTGFMSVAESRVGVGVCAVDLEAADRYFDFKYFEYGNFTTQNLNFSAIISNSFAKEHGLCVGDEMEILLLGESVVYTVQAIVEDEGNLIENDILVSYTGAVRILAKKSPEIAAIGDSFQPSNRLMIKLYNKNDTELLFQTLKSSQEFCDDYVENTTQDLSIDTSLMAKRVGVALPAILLVLLSAVLLVTALASLDAQREHEYALFRTAGADLFRLSLLRVTESSIYAIIGGAAGVLLASPMLAGVSSFFERQTSIVRVEWSGVLIGMLTAYLLMVGCTVVNILRKKTAMLYEQLSCGEYSGLRTSNPAVLFLLLCALVLSCVAIFLVAVNKRVIWGVLSVCLAVMVAYMGTPYVATAFSRVIQKRLLRRGKRAELILAQKNIENNFFIKHICRQLTVLLSILAVIFVCCDAISDQQKIYSDAFRGEILAYNMPSSIGEELKDTQMAQGVAQFVIHPDAKVNEKYSIILFSAQGDITDCLEPSIMPKTALRDGEIAVSKGIAALIGADVGDEVSVSVQGNAYAFKISEIMPDGTNIGYISTKIMDSSQSITCVRVGTQGENAYDQVVEYLNARGVFAINSQEYEIKGIDTMKGFVKLERWTAIIAILICLVGCINMIFEAYRIRKHERHILSLSGMEKRSIFKMGIYEGLSLLLIATVLSIAFGFLLCVFVHLSVQSFGFVLF